jgi:hypothetical protein
VVPGTRGEDSVTVAELIADLQRLPQDIPVYRYANWPVERITLESDTPETDDGKDCVTLY